MKPDQEGRQNNYPADRLTSGIPAAIRAEQKKLAAIYLRQPSLEQERSHTGSTESQRALVEIPLGWGWPESHIWVIENDLGLSGLSASERVGFQQLLDAMDRGEVGIVFVREISRLSRNPLDLERFLTKAARRGVLVVVNGRLPLRQETAPAPGGDQSAPLTAPALRMDRLQEPS